MAIRILEIAPKRTINSGDDPILAHLAIQRFKWINEQSQKQGITDRTAMFDWIVNKGGKAYVKRDDNYIPVYGASIAAGQYIRTVSNNQWSNDLLDLAEISE